MRKTIEFILIFSIFGCSDNQKKLNHDEPFNAYVYFHSVDNIYENHYSNKGQLEFTIEHTYNHHPNKIIGDFISDSSTSIRSLKYDEKNNLISEITFILPRRENLKPKSEIYYKYNNNNNLIGKEVWENGSLIYKYIYAYNSKYLITKIITINKSFKREDLQTDEEIKHLFDSTNLYYDTSISYPKYNALGNVIEDKIVNNQNKQKGLHKFSYFNGKMKNSISLDEQGDTAYFMSFIYKNNLTIQINFNKPSNVIDTIWMTEHDKTLKIISFDLAKSYRKSIIDFKYNRKGDIIQSTESYQREIKHQ